MSFFEMSRIARSSVAGSRRRSSGRRMGVFTLVAGVLMATGSLAAPAVSAAPSPLLPSAESAPAESAPTESAAPDAPASDAPASEAPVGTEAPVAEVPASEVPAPEGAIPPVAAGDLSWGVAPSSPTGPDGRTRFDLTISPGEFVDDWISVSNFSDTPLVMNVYAQDAMTTVDGSFGLPPAAAESTGVGIWTGVTRVDDTDDYTIAPGGRLDIPFRVSVPAGTSPGEYFGGIVAAPAEYAAQPNADGSVVAVDRRVGARIYLNVPGARRPAITVTEPQIEYKAGWNPIAGTTTVTYEVQNPGNVRISGGVDLKLTGVAGWNLGDVPTARFEDLLPGARVTRTEVLTGVAPAVRISATLTLTPTPTTGVVDPTLPIQTVESTIWAFPWIIAAAVLLLILLIVFLVWRSRRLRRKNRALQAGLAAALAAQAVPAGQAVMVSGTPVPGATGTPAPDSTGTLDL